MNKRMRTLIKTITLHKIGKEEKEKVVIFTPLVAEARLIAKDLKKQKPIVFLGDTPIDDRLGLLESFRSLAGPDIFITTYAAGGHGCKLTPAKTCILVHDEKVSYACRHQAIGRVFMFPATVYPDVFCTSRWWTEDKK